MVGDVEQDRVSRGWLGGGGRGGVRAGIRRGLLVV